MFDKMSNQVYISLLHSHHYWGNVVTALQRHVCSLVADLQGNVFESILDCQHQWCISFVYQSRFLAQLLCSLVMEPLTN